MFKLAGKDALKISTFTFVLFTYNEKRKKGWHCDNLKLISALCYTLDVVRNNIPSSIDEILIIFLNTIHNLL